MITPQKQPTQDVDREEDVALAARIRDGESDAFDELYQLHAKRLLRRILRMTSEMSQAEDCLQQVFAEALRTISTYRGDGPLHGWLERIATHVVMDVYRKQYRWRAFVDRFRWGESAPVQPSRPEQAYWEAERTQLVRQVLKQMEPRKRMAVTLCELEDMTIEEAALQMDVPVGTAASRLFHGKKAFRKQALATAKRMGIPVEEWLHE